MSETLPYEIVSDVFDFGEKFASATDDEELALVLKTISGTVSGFQTFAEKNPWQAAAVLLATTAVSAALAPEIAAGATALAGSSLMGVIGDAMIEVLLANGWTEIAASQLAKAALQAVSQYVVSEAVNNGV